MAILRKSLAEDHADRYNHRWAFLMLLVLSLITWLLPLSPVLQSDSTSPKYIATCWCPAQFENSMVEYTNAFCGAAYNRAMAGGNDDEDIPLWFLDEGKPARVGENEGERFKPSADGTEQDDDTKTETRYFMSVKTPLFLFVLAICFKLPHMIWMLLSGCAGINIDQTLEALNDGRQTLDAPSRRQLIKAVSESAKSSSSSTTVLYLMFKVLTLAVAVAALVVTHAKYLPDVDRLTDATGENKDLQMNTTTTQILMCEFSIRKLAKVENWVLQCSFTAPSTQHSPNLEMYESLFMILQTSFVILAIINLISLVTWVFKLMPGSCRHRVTSNTDLSLDGYLLLYMARENAGHLVVKELGEDLGQGREKGEVET